MIFHCTAILLISLGTVSSHAAPKAVYPFQLSADIKITAHLIPADQEYPPRLRYMHIDYDYVNKLARADIAEGYEAEKTYIRRYDTENEYMIRKPPINDCKRSFLGEEMPFPDISVAEYLNDEVIEGELTHHFVFNDFETLVHLYMAKGSGAPVRLEQGSVVNGEYIALLSYDYTNVVIGEPKKELFEVLSPFTHKLCERHVGGFPYLHVFHYFVRF